MVNTTTHLADTDHYIGCELTTRTCNTNNVEGERARLKELREAAMRLQSRLFFTSYSIFDRDDNSDDDAESEDDETYKWRVEGEKGNRGRKMWDKYQHTHSTSSSGYVLSYDSSCKTWMVFIQVQQDHPDPDADLAGPALGIMAGFAENPDGPDDDLFLIPLDLNL